MASSSTRGTIYSTLRKTRTLAAFPLGPHHITAVVLVKDDGASEMKEEDKLLRVGIIEKGVVGNDEDFMTGVSVLI